MLPDSLNRLSELVNELYIIVYVKNFHDLASRHEIGSAGVCAGNPGPPDTKPTSQVSDRANISNPVQKKVVLNGVKSEIYVCAMLKA